MLPKQFCNELRKPENIQRGKVGIAQLREINLTEVHEQNQQYKLVRAAYEAKPNPAVILSKFLGAGFTLGCSAGLETEECNQCGRKINRKMEFMYTHDELPAGRKRGLVEVSVCHVCHETRKKGFVDELEYHINRLPKCELCGNRTEYRKMRFRWVKERNDDYLSLCVKCAELVDHPPDSDHPEHEFIKCNSFDTEGICRHCGKKEKKQKKLSLSPDLQEALK